MFVNVLRGNTFVLQNGTEIKGRGAKLLRLFSLSRIVKDASTLAQNARPTDLSLNGMEEWNITGSTVTITESLQSLYRQKVSKKNLQTKSFAKKQPDARSEKHCIKTDIQS